MTFAVPFEAIHARAPGKINVFFRVGELQDDGYHDVASAYQAVSLYEDVYAYHADDFSVSFGGSIDTSGLSTDGSNLAIRAARLLARKTGYRGGVHLDIEKHVPIAGGMGGGSADAAATLVACDALWGTDATRDELLRFGAELGADVPFALMGGTAIGTGRGDQLSPALAKGNFHWVLALADFGMSTPAVFAELDRHRAGHAADIRPVPHTPVVDVAVLQALRAGDPYKLAEAIHNELQPATLALAPELASILELGEASGALAGIVSGSGPTTAFLAADADAAHHLSAVLAATGLSVLSATGPVHGARLLS